MGQRSVDEGHIKRVLENPEQSFDSGADRKIYQSRYLDEAEGKQMLLRVVAEPRLNEIYIVTVYKTSKIEKYLGKGNQP